MMHRSPPRPKPESWEERRKQISSPWVGFFQRFNWYSEWVSWALGNWVFLEVLEHLGVFSVLIAVIFYFADSGNRVKQKHYQAWQVINTAQGKGGSGGRIEALRDLNRDRVPLIGIDLGGAFLQGLRLDEARLARSDLRNADLRESSFQHADLTTANLRGANFRWSNLRRTILRNATLDEADLSNADLGGADISWTDFRGADLRYADLSNVRADGMGTFRLANVFGARNASPEFLRAILGAGAVSIESDEVWNKRLEAAIPDP